MPFISRRLLHAALILLGVTFISYMLLFLLPADPVRQIAGRSATPEVIASIRHQLELDLPFWQQYTHYLLRLLHGDLGRSFIQRSEVSALISARIGPSLELMAAGILCELLLGITLGTLAAVKRNTLLDKLLMAFSFIGVSAPQFIAAMLFLYLFSAVLDWFPMGGYGGFSHLALPALTLGVLGSGWYSRMLRSMMIDVLHEDFVRTARAKGLSRARVLFRHVLPNAVLPLIPMIGIDIGIFLGGLVVVESVFGWPGIGQLAWQAIQQVDIPVIVGVTTVSAVAIVGGNLIADLLLPWVDPRIDIKNSRGRP
ncbi:ABC transporter permease [Sodalis sp. RH19]|uniref:ABC transporter permease n=1 Tax=unclassified Sodalis (in: enterobacteria) TaxID=2636512 RepID=UPI0039B63648